MACRQDDTRFVRKFRMRMESFGKILGTSS